MKGYNMTYEVGLSLMEHLKPPIYWRKIEEHVLLHLGNIVRKIQNMRNAIGSKTVLQQINCKGNQKIVGQGLPWQRSC